METSSKVVMISKQVPRPHRKSCPQAEKRAHETTKEMLFPMILLIFAAVFIIILGPTIPIFMQRFGL